MLAGIAVAGAAACAAVASADFVIPTPHKPGPNASIAGDAVNGAVDAVGKRDRSCQPHPVRTGSTTTQDPPPQDMLDAFAVLRRPATAADTVDVQRSLPIAQEVAVDYIRRARVLADGTSVYVLPSLSARPTVSKRPASCSAREREALEHRLRGKPAQAQRAARRLLRDYQRLQHQAASSPPRAGMLVFASGPHGGGAGGGLDVAGIRERGPTPRPMPAAGAARGGPGGILGEGGIWGKMERRGFNPGGEGGKGNTLLGGGRERGGPNGKGRVGGAGRGATGGGRGGPRRGGGLGGGQGGGGGERGRRGGGEEGQSLPPSGGGGVAGGGRGEGGGGPPRGGARRGGRSRPAGKR